MKRRPVLLGLVVISLLSASATGLAMLVRHEPEFYMRSAVPPGSNRHQKSAKFWEDFSSSLLPALMGRALEARSLDIGFNDEDINSYLDEGPKERPGGNLVETFLPDAIREPRIVTQPDKIRLAFRYGTGPCSTVISVDLGVWVAAKDASVLAVEIQALHAGSVPISAQSVLERITEAAQQKEIDITWYRHNGHPVALVRFPTFHLQQLRLAEGEIHIVCSTNDAAPVRTAKLSPN